MDPDEELELCVARLGVMPEDKPSFVRDVYAVDDIHVLRQLLIEKERARQSLSNDLDMAARLGLVISETNEAMQYKISQLEGENRRLQEDLTTNMYYNDDHADDERAHLTRELDQARRELTKFRREMDGLTAQLNDMASEMVDSRSRVSTYVKRLSEVEHKLTTTREMNTNLQLLLEKALTSQKQSTSNTSHLVKNIQTDLSRVVTENDQLRARVAELEQQQVDCEDRLSVMATQAKDYATLLEQAQNTIHTLSEPRLDDDTLSNGFSAMSIASSTGWDSGGKESEITKGPVFSDEFRQEMQKEIERNLVLRNEMRHRIITAESVGVEKSKTSDGLKYLLVDREGTPSIIGRKVPDEPNLGKRGHDPQSDRKSDSDSKTNSKSSSSEHEPPPPPQTQTQTQGGQEPSHSAQIPSLLIGGPPPSLSTTLSSLRPTTFLTGFGGFSAMGTDKGIHSSTTTTSPATSFAARPLPWRTFSIPQDSNEASISTRFFQRLASRFDERMTKDQNTSLNVDK